MKKNIAPKIFEKYTDGVSGCVNREEQEALYEIIAGCRNKREASRENLYKKFYGYALGTALAYCNKRADASEVVNDSFMKVFRHIKSYNRSEPFKPWLRKIVVYTAIDKERAERRHKYHVRLDDIESSSPLNIESDLNAQQIFQLLNDLPELLRFVFNLYEIEGYSHREIAGKLDIAESSSRTYLTRAKTKLRQLYRIKFMDGRP
ncbi:MAG: RNA polymerase sigma factor [Balneolaceae bacterium]